MKRLLYLLHLLVYSVLVCAQSTYNYRYWFDGSETEAKTVSAGRALQMDVGVEDLTDGIHGLHVQVDDGNGVVSAPATKVFLKVTPQEKEDFMCRLSIDGETKWQSDILSKSEAFSEVLDVSDLDEGFHLANVMILSPNGQVKTIVSAVFLKIASKGGPIDSQLNCSISIDGTPVWEQNVSNSDGVLSETLDVSEFPEGFHFVTALLSRPNGEVVSSKTAGFLRVKEEVGAMSVKCFYSIDRQEYQQLDGNFNSGLFHFDVDVAELSDGLHLVKYMLMQDDGTISSVSGKYFIKIPSRMNHLTYYEYWVNDDYDNRKRIQFENETIREYSLTSLLEIQSSQVRSRSFHFEYTNGKPYIYAKNDFHVLFSDASGAVATQYQPFIDYHVAQEIADAELLVAGTPVEKTKPAENEIQWYHFPAAVGDSLSFKVDRACTVQVFAPSGKEVYSASGPDVVRWGGCHAWEDGEYYLALHDVTAQQGTTTRLEYQHIDKYAILTTDVLTVGNGGISTISHEGNGFYHLKDVYLVNSVSGEEIQAFNIEYLSDNMIRASYEFNGAVPGKYIQKFMFDAEERVNPQAITVEEFKENLLELSVNFSSTYVRGSNSTYTVTIKNLGNMSAYNVPLYSYIATNTYEGISKITIDGLRLPRLIDGIDLTHWKEDEIEDLKLLSDEIGDSHYYIAHYALDEETGDSCTVRGKYFYVELKPYEVKTIRFNITSNEEVNAWFTIPDEWISLRLAESRTHNAGMFKQPLYGPSSECIKIVWLCEKETLGEHVKGALSVGNPNVIDTSSAIGCTEDKLDKVMKVVDDLYVSGQPVSASDWSDVNRLLSDFSPTSVALSCLKENIPDTITLKGDELKQHTRVLVSAGEGLKCRVISYKRTPGKCPPRKNPGGGSGGGGGGTSGGKSTPVNSADPNDITGYTAESGSHFVKKDLVDVHYKIEFENDTTFATASAHTVVIKDTLDSRLFDLASFAPTSVKIGEKMVDLGGTPNFVKTIDMRPEIYAIAQVEGSLDKQKGIATWTFTSLDPMTMEPTDDVMSGFLPVNYDGRGQGEVTFDIKLRSGLADGTEIPNRASIVFDNEEAFMTPTWVNTIDAVLPVSRVTNLTVNDTIATISFDGKDLQSGIWHYDLYAQFGQDTSWELVAERVDTTSVDLRVYEDIEYGFCVIATDMAGNIERKDMRREYSLTIHDGEVDITDNLRTVVSEHTDAPTYYDLSGRHVSKPTQGLYINGQSKTVIVK